MHINSGIDQPSCNSLCLARHAALHQEETGQAAGGVGRRSNLRLQLHLWVLTLAYACFMVPMILVDTGLLGVMVGQDREERVGRALYSLYWWMFAMNFSIYGLFIEDFRNIYGYCLIKSFRRVRQRLSCQLSHC